MEIKFLILILAVINLSQVDSIAEGIHVEQSTSTFKDFLNRTILFRGINLVEKDAPYYPIVTSVEIDSLNELGFNLVRLGVMLPGLFPNSSTPDMDYLTKIKEIVELLWTNRIYTIIDLHQDVLAQELCGEGMPSWVINTTELNSLPFPEPVEFTTSYLPDPTTGKWEKDWKCNYDGYIPQYIGWSSMYISDASGKAWQQIYDNVGNLGYIFELYWKTVSSFLKNENGILAYEIINEPWFGDHVKDLSLLLEGGKGELNIMPFYERIHKIIRKEDPNTLILYSPIEMNNRLMRNVGFPTGFLPNEPMAFHVYCLMGTDSAGPVTFLEKAVCHANDFFQVNQRQYDLKRLKTAGIVTEFGAVNASPTGLSEIRFVADKFDIMDPPISWAFWGSLLSESIPYRKEIGRAFPQEVSGDIIYFNFDAEIGKLILNYIPTSSLATTISLPKLHYPNGWNINISPKDCCEIQNKTNKVIITYQKKSLISARLLPIEETYVLNEIQVIITPK